MGIHVKLLQNGVMDKDTDPQGVSGGNYIDAQNIRHRDDSSSNLQAVSPMKGNSLKVTIPDPTSTETVWRVYVKATYPYVINGSIGLYRNNVLSGPTTYTASLSPTSIIIASIDTVLNRISFSGAHSFSNGQLVTYLNLFGSAATPLVSGSSYYVKVITGTVIELYSNAALTSIIDITSAGSGSQELTSTPVNTLTTQIQSILTAFSAGFVYTTFTYIDSESGYFDVSHSTFDDFEIIESGNVIDRVVQLSEWVDFTSLVAKYKIIGMESVGDDTIVFLATPNYLSSSYITPYRSLSEIGVVQYNSATDSYTYTRLLKSKRLGFNVDYQIQADVEKRTQDVNIYWTDNYNKPRALSVPYPYVQDGVLSGNGGTIDISKVDKETALFVDTPSATMTYLESTEGGGSLKCGNKRYSGRFVTDDFVGTDYLYPSGLINVFSTNTTSASLVKGDQPGTLTNKSIKLRVNNIPSGEYEYFELVAIEYEGDTFTATMVQRYRLNNETSIEVVHSNNGQDNFPLSPAEILALTAKVTKVKSLRINSNRLFISNIEEMVDADLTQWASQITHSLEIQQIPSVWRGNRFGKGDTNKTYPNYRFGEYQDPQNVLNYTGYMMNDTYRFGIQVQWKKTGKWSSPYWVDDIRFDLSATNCTSPTRRLSNSITTTNFTNLDSDYVNIYYPKFHNIDLDYQIDGEPLYRLIKAYRIVRCDRIPEVLATGLLVGGVREDTDPGLGVDNLVPYHKDIVRTPTFTFSTFPSNYCRRDHSLAFRTSSYQNDILLANADNSEFGYFHSPDLYFNQVQYTYTAGDKMKVLSVPVPYDEYTLQGFNTGDYESVHQEYTGYFKNTLVPYTDFTIAEAEKFQTGEARPFGGMDKVKNGISVPPEGRTYANVNPFFSNMKACTVFKLTTKLSTIAGYTGLYATGSGTFNKEGLVYAQIFRDKGNTAKYPANKEQSVYETTNHLYIMTGNERGIQTNVSVFGGDVFTQKSHLKMRMSTFNSLNYGFGLGYAFYSQNIANTQMFHTIDHNDEQEGPGYIYPQYMEKFVTGLNETGYKRAGNAYIRDWSPTFTGVTTLASNVVTYVELPQGSWGTGLLYWLEQWPEVDNQNNYDSQFSVIDNVFTETGFDPNSTWDGKRPASIRFSQIKSTGSERDNYRVFKPIDVVDLDTNQGEIVDIVTVNGNLYSLQPDSFTRHYVSDNQIVNSESGTELIIGSGGVLNNKGQQLSSFGATSKFAIAKGKTFTGDENLYWWNSRAKKLIRFGGNGVQVISDKGLISYLINNTDWHTRQDQPINGQGVVIGYNQRFYEVVMSFTAVDPSIAEFQTYTDTTYTPVVQYPINSLVVNSHNGDVLDFNYYGESEVADRHISGVPFVYLKTVNNLDTINSVPQFGATWPNRWQKLTPDTHPQYFKIFTLVYDEVKNGFIGFMTEYPNIISARGNTYYTSKPDDQNKIYVANSGNYSTFYGTQYNGHIEGVVNIDPNLSKNFEAVQVVSDITPERLDFATRDHVSFLTSAEFEELEDFYYAPIKNDSTGTGVNSNDTSRLWGRYLKIKLRFAPNIFQKLINYVVKYRPNPRLYNK